MYMLLNEAKKEQNKINSLLLSLKDPLTTTS